MSKFKKKKSEGQPAISTASLPDIVFMLLFFFMVVTVMRQNTLMVQNKLPFADQVEKLDKKDLVMYIYAGKPSPRYQQTFGKEARIQLNDKFASVGEVQQFIFSERETKREELIPYLTTALKVDEETNMGLVSDIKQELRKAEALKINYTTKEGEALQNMQ
ncbi:ExbD/TolR family protein [Salegentibacter mishustinae]|jgi:biopolymer transport protein ExbD|uniref:Biopolymer transporter ExbD n=1 Tax=Salegentibacter mishustinae TaxID=270918 RepID=A0A0Q9Z7I1_9FLAO|nr:biopolymer transporter ExbD [Salegentibacter mishustinae]KRG27897.1 biopolymer transporter ExbD [Salegentibacter mishustinae]MDX1719679.1 biopolymer transporter ExbD [Salegentibacter mishustinae]PNW20965.1 biopolymer transporter ExbD [Salegentibacter mishustinae]PZX64016.1 biopolymer transport protein ExbD [Salegentibacter mishustinae]GGW89589.1 biopolymer transporter ExbD [Salegentibacter mishustinae]|tara:strand:- start:520 stop:1002 length:483 start_codon:yes stop_codon:yes gene_type:complete